MDAESPEETFEHFGFRLFELALVDVQQVRQRRSSRKRTRSPEMLPQANGKAANSDVASSAWKRCVLIYSENRLATSCAELEPRTLATIGRWELDGDSVCMARRDCM